MLITGGTGALGGLVARHLVAEEGVRHLVLTSRGGPPRRAPTRSATN
ncbi:KR domain-containing protein [Streptomyces sp. M19]